jgi:hypothetical protein
LTEKGGGEDIKKANTIAYLKAPKCSNIPPSILLYIIDIPSRYGGDMKPKKAS